jgi:hypothetical protein
MDTRRATEGTAGVLDSTGAVKSRLPSDGNWMLQIMDHSYIRGEKPTRAGLLPVRKLSVVSV